MTKKVDVRENDAFVSVPNLNRGNLLAIRMQTFTDNHDNDNLRCVEDE